MDTTVDGVFQYQLDRFLISEVSLTCLNHTFCMFFMIEYNQKRVDKATILNENAVRLMLNE